MEPLQIAERIKERFPDSVLGTGEFRGQVSVTIKREDVLDVCRFLHDSPELDMKHLRDLAGVDWMGKKQERFEVVYHLYSINKRHMIRLKVPVCEFECYVPSVTPIWKGADWHERECFDLLGILFKGHPDLRRILLPEDWKGHPLRKDYPVRGPELEDDWEGYKHLIEDSRRLKEHEWNR